jgi:hypothetical protein
MYFSWQIQKAWNDGYQRVPYAFTDKYLQLYHRILHRLARSKCRATGQPRHWDPLEINNSNSGLSVQLLFAPSSPPACEFFNVSHYCSKKYQPAREVQRINKLKSFAIWITEPVHVWVHYVLDGRDGVNYYYVRKVTNSVACEFWPLSIKYKNYT